MFVIVAYRMKSKAKQIVPVQIALLGQRNSGKTQLFIKMTNGIQMETVHSIKNNKAKITIQSKDY